MTTEVPGVVYVASDTRIVDSHEGRGVTVEEDSPPTGVTVDGREWTEEPPIEQHGVAPFAVVGRRERVSDPSTVRRDERFDRSGIDERHIPQRDDRGVEGFIQCRDTRPDGTRLPGLEHRIVGGPNRKPRNRLGDAVGLVTDHDDDRVEAGRDERPGGEFDDRVPVVAREQFVLVAEPTTRPRREENPSDRGLALRRVERRFVDRT